MKILEGFKRLIHQESFGGIFLFICALLAMVVANSSWSEAYFSLWNQKVGFLFGETFVGFSLHLWINDVLMSLFFLMVGLEIKREFLFGGLAGFKKAAFPAIAAIGGMIVPAGIYLFFNLGTSASHGFGIPMATDIAFALGVVLLLGNRVPPALKLFLVTLAVVDDLGAIIVIAVFYSSGVSMMWLGISACIVAILIVLNRVGIRSLVPYLLLGVLLWLCVHESGIHATISAVILAFCIPVSSKTSREKFLEVLRDEGGYFASAQTPNLLLDMRQIHSLHKIQQEIKSVQNPLLRIEHALHSWSKFFIMPLFAFANAGVKLEGGIDLSSLHIVYGIALGLVVGKPLGILLFTLLCEKLGIASRPNGLSWGAILGAGMLAGIGFTMSMFVSNLAFDVPIYGEIAKISILSSSVLAGILGSLFLLFLGKKTNVLESRA
ncbi:Na+/H+ antiporter NhaA [Helicobacter kayseriensis]|uniref:Na+/H+ antiporter NhaA n=1 Tax=Helicobacter kayseriensis TaxID=2905877 RepID=UPI001E528B05|nr:Na+/H+ antiporter NhaA [Helicobacter kayseriensis]MCE3047093.1 Na+/H+ antiporter NhaA [Helicobacter kayseriensis]MCE3048247.1 Na+/H+ antiporter NhaA [Helicobacter kayseriensis]